MLPTPSNVNEQKIQINVKSENIDNDNDNEPINVINNHNDDNDMYSQKIKITECDTNCSSLSAAAGFSDTAILDDKTTKEAVVAPMTIPNKLGGSSHRPAALNLKPIFFNPNCDTHISFNNEEPITVTTPLTVQTPLTTSYHTKDEEHATKAVNATQKYIDIGFRDVVYTVRKGLCWSRETKIVLDGISGEFRAGELTAIMGPSGAGKSTLLDILTGYTTNLVEGKVTINGGRRDLKLFRRQTAYIMQDHLLQIHITVWEAMYFSINLKTGNYLNKVEKKNRIKEILEAIALYDLRKVRTGVLSGGQRKRLAIALELVDNPPVMFFDEPTCGLDSSTSTQVILLLKQLAQEGRTIVCTIHQPSAIIFGLFDHLYAIAEGQCIYSGGTQMLVPFLDELGLSCPKTYNPSDYLLEISTHDYGEENGRLVEKIQNGKNLAYRMYSEKTAQICSLGTAEKMMENGLVTPIKAPTLTTKPPKMAPSVGVGTSPLQNSVLKKPKITTFQLDTRKCCQNSGTYATSSCAQALLLLHRSFLILYRDRSLTAMRITIHTCVALLVGTLYFGIGNDASMVFNNFRYVFLSIMFLMFTSYSSSSLSFPLELPIITREHFNRWYSIKAYYFALIFSDLPIQIACICVYVLITYLMTAQPLEYYRMGMFYFIILMVTLVSQSWGMVVGAVFGVKYGTIIGPFCIAPFMIFSGFFVRFADAHTALHWLFETSYLFHALNGASLALFGYDRPRMDCYEIYCHYRYPKKFLELIDTHNRDYLTAAIVLLSIFVGIRIIAYYIMSMRVKRRLGGEILCIQ